MEKTYEVFFPDGVGTVTYLDDFFAGPDRPNETSWNLKQDPLIQDGCPLADIVSGTHEPVEEDILQNATYLGGICTKGDTVEAKTFSEASLTFATLEYDVKGNVIGMEERSLPETVADSSASKSEESASYDTGDPSASSIEESAPQSPSDGNIAYSKYCSEYARSSGGGQRGTSFQSLYGIRSAGVERHRRSGYPSRKKVPKPPSAKDKNLDDLRGVFHMARPKAEKKLDLKRTTFSCLNRHYGISKWPFRTIRDAVNRMEANEVLLRNRSLSKSRRRKLQEQQRLLLGVIRLIYSDPQQSRDANTLAVLLNTVDQNSSPEWSEL